MNLFDRLVELAISKNTAMAHLQPVVEKELLHHDILREMSRAGLLSRLVFIGGTCLRTCYGSQRLSEDLDFAGGSDFECSTLDGLVRVLEESLFVKYGLKIEVSEPTREEGNAATWKMRITTRPEQRHLPVQRINIDVCTVPSHDHRPSMLRNYYGVDMGTSGLIIQSASREEILADKFIALAFRPNRVKHRDLWDIVWLKQQGIVVPYNLLPLKIKDHKRSLDEYLLSLNERQVQLMSDNRLHDGFIQEMRRFLPLKIVMETIEQPDFWAILTDNICSECLSIINRLK